MMKKKLISVLIVFLIIAAGVLTGYFLSSRQLGKKATSSTVAGTKIKKGMTFGVNDLKTFKDSAIGVLEVNDGSFTTEGSHRLIREGGSSQTAYLTSSVLDLNEFVGRKVKVWGQTSAAQKAGWLMDIGKIEILE